MSLIDSAHCQPRRSVTTDDVTVEIATSELLELEAALLYRRSQNGSLDANEALRLRVIEREINERWSLR